MFHYQDMASALYLEMTAIIPTGPVGELDAVVCAMLCPHH